MGGKRSAVPNAQLEQMRQKLQQQPGQGAVPRKFVPTALHITESNLCKEGFRAL